ncbi:MAG TPA: hypothetical protein VLZ28_01170 [Daejeonella sp.]|nr:hypothetical protein [Daejeonella sp.]
MKIYAILLFCFIGLSLSSCSTNKTNKAKQDSLAAAAAADSMLNEALKADSLKADTDSI